MNREEILQVAKPILFNTTDMVESILNGTKVVTRQAIKSPAEVHECSDGILVTRPKNYPDEYCRLVPYEPYKIGDYLYVRETWTKVSDWTTVDPEVGLFDGFIYKADWSETESPKWHSPIHMPKEAARIFLMVTDVRVERLQNISNDQAVSEGAVKHPNYTKRGDLVLHNRYKTEFSSFWNSTIKKSDLSKYGWNANPYVWCISFGVRGVYNND